MSEDFQQAWLASSPAMISLEVNPPVDQTMLDSIKSIEGVVEVEGEMVAPSIKWRIVMPHRHCHEAGFNGDDTDRTYRHYHSHQDAHAPLTRATHHIPRYGLLLYYPQEVPLDFGPTHVLPGTQYHKGLIREEKDRGRPTGGAKGSAAIIHFDAGHGVGVNRRQIMRYMVKFVIGRTEDPAVASWLHENPEWIRPDNVEASHEQPLIWQHVWNWMRGD